MSITAPSIIRIARLSHEGLDVAAALRDGGVTDIYAIPAKAVPLYGMVTLGRIERLMAKSAIVDMGSAGQAWLAPTPGDMAAGDTLKLRMVAEAAPGKLPRVLRADDAQETRPALTVLERALDDHPGAIILESPSEEDETTIENALREISTPYAPLPEGGSLMIEPTSALVAVDVNAGSMRGLNAVNAAAVKALARHMRWRQLCGLIIMDCAGSITNAANRASLLDLLKSSFADDPAGVHVHGLSKLGLAEITRTRRGWSWHEARHL